MDATEKLGVGALVDTSIPYGIGRVAAIDSVSATVRFFKGRRTPSVGCMCWQRSS